MHFNNRVAAILLVEKMKSLLVLDHGESREMRSKALKSLFYWPRHLADFSLAIILCLLTLALDFVSYVLAILLSPFGVSPMSCWCAQVFDHLTNQDLENEPPVSSEELGENLRQLIKQLEELNPEKNDENK